MNHQEANKHLRGRVLANSELRAAVERFRSHGAGFLPGSGNLGDALIQLGTFDYFDEVGGMPEVIAGMTSEGLSGRKHVILGGGGGWIEGRYTYYPEILTPFLESGGELLILPTTFWGFQSFLRRFARQITVFTREQQSFDALAAVPGLNGLYLADDMAFATNPEHFIAVAGPATHDTIKIIRRDGEARVAAAPHDSIDLPIVFNNTQWVSRDVSLPPLLAAAQTLRLFKTIETDRLHMAVLSAMIGMQVAFRDNSYFKNRGVFERSLAAYDGVKMPAPSSKDAGAVPDAVYADRARLLDRIEFLNGQLQISRRRNIWLIERGQHSNGTTAPATSPGTVPAPLDPMLASFQKSRGFRLWRAYNRLYEHRVFGRPMKLARRLAADIRRTLRH